MKHRALLFTAMTLALAGAICLMDSGGFSSLVTRIFLGYCTIITGHQAAYALTAPRVPTVERSTVPQGRQPRMSPASP